MNDKERLASLERTLANLGQMVLDQAEEIQELRAELEAVRTIAEVALKNAGR